MRTYSTSFSPFLERPYFTSREIEQICQDELRKTGYFPSNPEAVRIEHFIKKRFNITPIFENLPDGVLGYTTFDQSGVVSMHIASALTESDTRAAECRTNSTLAHEAGHGLLHAHLFAFSDQGLSLFGGDPDVTATKILCRGSGGGVGNRTYKGQWWELQANMVIGSLLMPRPLVVKSLQPFFRQEGMFQDVDPLAREDAVRCLGDTFDVNPIVARIRLDELYPAQGAQLRL